MFKNVKAEFEFKKPKWVNLSSGCHLGFHLLSQGTHPHPAARPPPRYLFLNPVSHVPQHPEHEHLRSSCCPYPDALLIFQIFLDNANVF